MSTSTDWYRPSNGTFKVKSKKDPALLRLAWNGTYEFYSMAGTFAQKEQLLVWLFASVTTIGTKRDFPGPVRVPAGGDCTTETCGGDSILPSTAGMVAAPNTDALKSPRRVKSGGHTTLRQ